MVMSISDESRKFIINNPLYEPTPDNNEKILDFLILRNWRLTTDNLQRAYDVIFKGLPEPKVMTPEAFFEKVKPLQSLPEEVKQEINYLKLLAEGKYAGDLNSTPLLWPESQSDQDLPKPKHTVAGALTGNDGGSSIGTAEYKIQETLLALAKLNKQYVAAKQEEKEFKKNVAPMPVSWYASETVELNTERRIKDDTD